MYEVAPRDAGWSPSAEDEHGDASHPLDIVKPSVDEKIRAMVDATRIACPLPGRVALPEAVAGVLKLLVLASILPVTGDRELLRKASNLPILLRFVDCESPALLPEAATLRRARRVIRNDPLAHQLFSQMVAEIRSFRGQRNPAPYSLGETAGLAMQAREGTPVAVLAQRAGAIAGMGGAAGHYSRSPAGIAALDWFGHVVGRKPSSGVHEQP